MTLLVVWEKEEYNNKDLKLKPSHTQTIDHLCAFLLAHLVVVLEGRWPTCGPEQTTLGRSVHEACLRPHDYRQHY